MPHVMFAYKNRLSVLLKLLYVSSRVSSSITLILKHMCVPM